MTGWLRSAGSGPLIWKHSSATSIAWITPHERKRKSGGKGDCSRAGRTWSGRRGAGARTDEKWTLVLVRAAPFAANSLAGAHRPGASARVGAFDADGSLRTVGRMVKLDGGRAHAACIKAAHESWIGVVCPIRVGQGFTGGPIELEHLDPADPPLGVDRLHGDGHCQLHCSGPGKRDASALGDVLAAAPARFLLFTGLYLFALPYAAKWRRGRTT